MLTLLWGTRGLSSDSARRKVLHRLPGAGRRAAAAAPGCSRRCSRPTDPIWDKADEIKEVEHKCDFLTHEIIQRLNRTFVTPLDREDIHALARSLDDVMDAIDAVGVADPALPARDGPLRRARAGADHHRLDRPGPAWRSTPSRSNKGLITHAVEINRLENEADRIHQQAVSRLFDDERDPIMVMKWKETLDFLEAATDRCEDVANVLEGVMVKHG